MVLLVLVEENFYKLFLPKIFSVLSKPMGFYFKLSIRNLLSMKKMKYLQTQTTLFLKKVFPLMCPTHAMTNIN